MPTVVVRWGAAAARDELPLRDGALALAPAPLLPLDQLDELVAGCVTYATPADGAEPARLITVWPNLRAGVACGGATEWGVTRWGDYDPAARSVLLDEPGPDGRPAVVTVPRG